MPATPADLLSQHGHDGPAEVVREREGAQWRPVIELHGDRGGDRCRLALLLEPDDQVDEVIAQPRFVVATGLLPGYDVGRGLLDDDVAAQAQSAEQRLRAFLPLTAVPQPLSRPAFHWSRRCPGRRRAEPATPTYAASPVPPRAWAPEPGHRSRRAVLLESIKSHPGRMFRCSTGYLLGMIGIVQRKEAASNPGTVHRLGHTGRAVARISCISPGWCQSPAAAGCF